MKTHDEMVAEWMKDPAFKIAYNALDEKFTLFDELLKARLEAGLTQAEVAQRMQKHSPSVATLRRYAQAVGGQLEIRLVRKTT